MKIDGLSEKQKMLRGELYNATDRELVVERPRAESRSVSRCSETFLARLVRRLSTEEGRA